MLVDGNVRSYFVLIAEVEPRGDEPRLVLRHRDHVDRKSTRLNSSHLVISYAVFCLKKKRCAEVRQEAVPLARALFAAKGRASFSRARAKGVRPRRSFADPLPFSPAIIRSTRHGNF